MIAAGRGSCDNGAMTSMTIDLPDEIARRVRRRAARQGREEAEVLSDAVAELFADEARQAREDDLDAGFERDREAVLAEVDRRMNDGGDWLPHGQVFASLRDRLQSDAANHTRHG